MGVGKPTEMTIRDLLPEELRKRGVTVVSELSVSTSTGGGSLSAESLRIKNALFYKKFQRIKSISLV